MGSSKARPIKRLLRRKKIVRPHVCNYSHHLPNSLDVKDSVLGVHGSLVLSGLTDETLLVGERDKGGGSVATLVVGD